MTKNKASFNDTQEFHDAIGFISAEINSLISNTSYADQKAALNEMLEAMGGDNSEMNACACCVSEDGDSLLQWSAYSGTTSGPILAGARCIYFYANGAVFTNRGYRMVAL